MEPPAGGKIPRRYVLNRSAQGGGVGGPEGVSADVARTLDAALQVEEAQLKRHSGPTHVVKYAICSVLRLPDACRPALKF